MFHRLRRWWFYREDSSALRALTAAPVVAGLAVGGWLAAGNLTGDDASAVAYYEVTTERRVTVRVDRTAKPKVRLVRQIRRVYVDPETVRSTRVVTTPGGVRTVMDAVVRTVPVTTERVVTLDGKRITVARTVVQTRTRVVTATEQAGTTSWRTTTIPITTTRHVTETRPVTTIVRTTDTETTTISTTVEVQVTTTVTVTRRKD